MVTATVMAGRSDKIGNLKTPIFAHRPGHHALAESKVEVGNAPNAEHHIRTNRRTGRYPPHQAVSSAQRKHWLLQRQQRLRGFMMPGTLQDLQQLLEALSSGQRHRADL